MKKVWVLEKFADVEELKAGVENAKAGIEWAKTQSNEAMVEAAEQYLKVAEKLLSENPNGHWYGFEGKTNYKHFCQVAKDAINRHPDGKFRVVEGTIDDCAKYWCGYEVAKVNDGVYRYLMATARK